MMLNAYNRPKAGSAGNHLFDIAFAIFQWQDTSPPIPILGNQNAFVKNGDL